MATQTKPKRADRLLDGFRNMRRLSVALAEPLSDADATIQPMPDASPAKWHLAHTSWFFDTFVLRDYTPGRQCRDERWAYLFNSYYDSEGERHARPRRGMLSRPSLDEVLSYRRAVDEAIERVIPQLPEPALDILELGINHEQQHQELMLMDLLATFAENPLNPAVWDPTPDLPAALPPPVRWLEGASGVVEIGQGGQGFAFDCEGPRHKVFLHPHALADRLVTNGEWVNFIQAGGYADPLLWLSDGWAWVNENRIAAPLYWRRGDSGWSIFGLDGERALNPAEPVCHISYYEADAFARWAGARLPTEAEWESVAATADPAAGNQLVRAGAVRPTGVGGWFGDAWIWTASAFLPYPGFRPAAGAIGEYNGKFMSSQMVLRGGSCATPRGHMRASYRNFFYPHQRWMFSGLRLAKDL
ncbi:MAG TPA: ergothioneine biosynthesis protein EgtB [Allosphingosinicella sp.]|nr:ergothioneine biosynthesis protein EgtB [Allosphingosinicella sp.]